MNRQSQWLFEAPITSATTYHTNLYANLEHYSNPELAEGCQNRTSDCPPSGVLPVIVSGYVTHNTKVPRGEQGKIKTVADSIVRSANLGSQSKVCIVGHADKDPRGENFERDISRQRAVEAMKALTSAISNPSVLSKVNWKLVCAGKDNPVVGFNKPLAQRVRNRRVEIFVVASLPPQPVPVPGNSCGNLLIWINAFIPRDVLGYTFTIPAGPHAGKTAIPCPLGATPANPNCFRLGYLTDQRTFDSGPTASVRMRSIAEIQLVSSKLLRADHYTSGTTEINKNTGAITCVASADMKKCKFGNFASSPLPFPFGDFLIKLSVKAAASDPCVNLAADIDYEGNIEILCSPSRGTVEVGFDGKVDSFPAFEMYASLNGTTKTLFRLPPPSRNTVVNLLGGASTPISGKAVFNCSLINKGTSVLSTRTLKTRPLARSR